MSNLPFTIRNGIYSGKTITNDLPKSSRTAIYIVLARLVSKGAIDGDWYSLFEELCRSCRIDFFHSDISSYDSEFKKKFYEAKWERIFVFLERVYKSYLVEVFEYDMNGNAVDHIHSLDEVKSLYLDEVTNILLEDNIDFEFVDGEFLRRGRSITKKNVERVGAVLSDPSLHKVRSLYSKSLNFFRDTKTPDFENTIKEAFCALELAIEIITGRKVSKDFATELRKLSGNDEGMLSPPVVEALIKMYGYRNNGKGVSHGADKGLRVSEHEAEMILNLVAMMITYIYDYYKSLEQDEVPF